MDEINSQQARRVVVSTGAMAVLHKELDKQACRDSVDELQKRGTGQLSKESFSRKHMVAAHEKCKKTLEDLRGKGLQGALVVTIGPDRVVEEPESDEGNEAAGGGPLKLRSVASLREIFLPQLELNARHHGRVLFGTLCVSPFQISSVMTVMADKSGKAVRVSISNRRGLLSNKELEARFRFGLKVGIKEPYLKMCPDNVVAIKVDDPSHFVHVDDSNRETLSELEATIEGLDKIRAEGNTLFVQQKWVEAIEQYTDCIKRCNDLFEGPHKENDKIRQCLLLAYSNRSEVWLQLTNFKHALDDANMALEYDSSHQKSISRRDRAWQGFGKVQVSSSKVKLPEEDSREPFIPEAKHGIASDVQEVQEVLDGREGPPSSTVRKPKSSKDASRTSKGPSSHGGRPYPKNNSSSRAEETDLKGVSLPPTSHNRDSSVHPSKLKGTGTKDSTATVDSSEGKPSSRRSSPPSRVEPSVPSHSASPSKFKNTGMDTSLTRTRNASEVKTFRGKSTSPVRVQSTRRRSVSPSKSENNDVKDSAVIVDLFEGKHSRQNSRSPLRSETRSEFQRVSSKDLLADSSSSKPELSESVTDATQNGSSDSKLKLVTIKTELSGGSSSKSGPTEVKGESSKGKQASASKRKRASTSSQSKDDPSTGVFKPKSTSPVEDGFEVVASEGKGSGKSGHNSSPDSSELEFCVGDVVGEKANDLNRNAGVLTRPLDATVEDVNKDVENKRSNASPTRWSSVSGLGFEQIMESRKNNSPPRLKGKHVPPGVEEITESRKNYSPQRLKGKHAPADGNVTRSLLPQGSKSKILVTDSSNVSLAHGSAEAQREPPATVDHEGPLFATWLDSIRSSGDLLLNEEKWADAVVKYDKVTKVRIPKRNRDRVIQTILLAVSHRSEAWIWLGNYENALRDADSALEFMDSYQRSVVDYEAEYLLNEVRRGRAFYGLGEYDKSCAIFAAALEASPYEKSISDLLEKSRICFEQSRKGIYYLDHYFLSACDRPPPPCSDYVGPIEIRSVPGKGRGLFLTRDVYAGDLLLVSNPLAVVRRRLYRPGGGGRENDEENYRLLTSKWRKSVTSFGLDEFISRLALSQSARKRYQFLSLAAGSAGDEAEVPDINAFIAGSKFELPEDWSIPEDEEHLRSIVRWNAIDGGLNPLVGTTSKNQDKEEIICFGLWALPSFMNHSCVPNCHMIDVGNAMFVRASCNMQRGEELTRAYFDVLQNGLYRQRITKEEWDFICNCQRCTLEKSLTLQRVLPLQEYRSVLESVREESRRRNESGEKDRALSLLLPNPNPAHLKLRKFADSFDRVLFSVDGLTCKEKAWIGASYLEAYVSRFVGSKDRDQLVLALENILDFMTNITILGAGEAQTTLARASFLLQEVIRFHGAGSHTHRRIEVRVLDLYATAYGKLGKEILLAMSQIMASSGKAFTGLIDDHLRWESRSPLHYFAQGSSPAALALQYH